MLQAEEVVADHRNYIYIYLITHFWKIGCNRIINNEVIEETILKGYRFSLPIKYAIENNYALL